MVCRNGQARSSRDRQTGRDSHRRTFLIGRGCSSGRVHPRNPDCHRERANRNNPVCQDNRDRRTRRAFSNRQILSSQVCSGSLMRPACSGPDCKTGLHCRSCGRPCPRQRENRGGKGARADAAIRDQ